MVKKKFSRPKKIPNPVDDKPKIQEAETQVAVVNYFKANYPHYARLCKGDAFNGLQKLSPYIAKKAKAMGNLKDWPDIQVPVARKGHIGFFLELKREGFRVRKLNGELIADEHVRSQSEYLDLLASEGHFAKFACGFDEAKKWIDWYFG